MSERIAITPAGRGVVELRRLAYDGLDLDDVSDWLAAHDAKVKAEALREAAEDLFYDGDRDRPLLGYELLVDRANQIEKGSTDEHRG